MLQWNENPTMRQAALDGFGTELAYQAPGQPADDESPTRTSVTVGDINEWEGPVKIWA